MSDDSLHNYSYEAVAAVLVGTCWFSSVGYERSPDTRKVLGPNPRTSTIKSERDCNGTPVGSAVARTGISHLYPP